MRVVAASLLAGTLFGVVAVAALVPARGPDRPPVPVLVELFTSEGCSSCPPADALLRTLLDGQPVDGAEVIGLSEHVDYWNRLGWTDPFSSPLFSARQEAYARARNTDRIYTPQLVVNGRESMVGSSAPLVRAAIARAARAGAATLGIRTSLADARLTVRVSVAHAPPGVDLDDYRVVVAIAEDGLVTDVLHGENARRQLHHDAVARSIETLGRPRPVGEALVHDVGVDPAWATDRLAVVAFLQHPRTRAVAGVARARVVGAGFSPPARPPERLP